MIPYLPDILRKVVEEVSLEFSEREEDDFKVLFNHGNYTQMWRDADKEEFKQNPAIWLVMPFTESMTSPLDYRASGIELVIFMKSDSSFSQEQRDEIVFKPVLLPVYEELMKQISRRVEFGMPNAKDLSHTRIVRPHWMLGPPQGGTQPNLIGHHVDAVYVLDLKLTVKKIC